MAEERVAAGSPFESFIDYVKQALEIVQLKPDAIDAAAADEGAFSMGLIVVALAGVALSIGTFNPFGLIAYPVFFLVAAFIWSAVLHLLATLAFKGEGDFMSFFRPFSLSYVLQWVNVIWVLGVMLSWLAGLWMLAVTVIVIERVYKLDRPKAIATVAIPTVALFLIAVLFGTLLVGMLVLLGLQGG